MSFRKIERGCALAGLTPWTEPVIKSTELVDELGNVTITHQRKDLTTEEINEQQLDPGVITLSSLIKNGTTIEPKNVGTMLNPTDRAYTDEMFEAHGANFVETMDKQETNENKD